MRVFTADETGLIKEVSIERSTVVRQWGEQRRELTAAALCFEPGEKSLLLGRRNGALAALECSPPANRPPPAAAAASAPTSFDITEDITTTSFCTNGGYAGLEVHGDTVVSCDTAGLVCYRSLAALRANAREARAAAAAAGNDDFSPLEIETEHRIQAHASAIRMRVRPDNVGFFAVGGEEAGLRLWDVSRPKAPIFKAKNVKNDRINLRVPVHVADMAFVPDTGGTQLITVSKYHVICRYDTRVKTRPVLRTELGEHALTTLSAAPDASAVVVADTVGTVTQFDLRMNLPNGTFRGFAGSVRCVQHHPTQPYVAAVGLDRFLRVYELGTRRVKAKVYLKQSLTSLAFSSEDELRQSGESGEIEGSGEEQDGGKEGKGGGEVQESDELWDSLAVAGQKRGASGSATHEAAAPPPKSKSARR